MILFILKIVVGLWIFKIGYVANKKIDKEFAAAAKQKKAAAVVAIIYLIAALMLKVIETGVYEVILNSLFWASLTLAAYSDYLTTEIRDLTYIPAIASGTLSIIKNIDMVGKQNIQELIIFILIQWILFRFFYGESDCLAFSVCALYMTVEGRGIITHLILMAITIMLLGVVQGLKKNINRKGNLKRQVPMIPYIAVAMLLC